MEKLPNTRMNEYCVLRLKHIPTSARQWALTLPNNFPTLGLEFNGFKYIRDKNANNKHDQSDPPKCHWKGLEHKHWKLVCNCHCKLWA